jgi:ribonuclease R
VEGLVHVSSLVDDWYEYRSRQNRLVGRKNRRTYMLGDRVEVVIQKVDVLRHQIDLAVVLPDGEDDELASDRLQAGEMAADQAADDLGRDSADGAPAEASLEGGSLGVSPSEG